jgi:hypothetical protein
MDVARGLGRIVSVLGLAGAVLLVPAPVLADCQLAPPLDKAVIDAASVFVGTVSSVRSHGFSAEVDVREVWRGAIVGHVVVDGGLDPAHPAEDDRQFEVGVTYLFLPTTIDGRLVDSICSATTPWVEEAMAGLRPPEGLAPEPTPSSQSGLLSALGGVSGPVLVAAIVGGLLIVTVLVARRRET